jgi:hypothetical protein
MICDRARCREVSRRIRDDLIHLGLVVAGPSVALADGARASAGDLIICRHNDHTVEAGEPGRTLANGDLLRIEAIRGRTLLVRRALDCDPVTGERRWTSRAFEYRGYQTADLGYAVTGHSAQGRSVQAGIAVVTGTEDRQWLYVAMTRGAESNTMIVFTQPGTIADPEAGTRPAPELARQARIARDRAGLPAADTAAGPADERPEPREAIAVAADALENDGAEMSALETRASALASADHLAVLNAIWQGETAELNVERYRKIVHAAMPPQYAADGLTSPQATWLWRTLRGVEAAGLEVADVVQQAVDSRSLAGARYLAAVIDTRIRWLTGPVVPLPQGPWSERVPHVAANLERQQFLTELAAAMDARRERIGEHTSEYPPDWALRSLGQVPDDPSTGSNGSAAPPASVPTASCTDTSTPPTRSDPNPPGTARRSEPPGTQRSPRLARSTVSTFAAFRTARCCTCAPPTKPRPPGHHGTSAANSNTSESAPTTPASVRSVHSPNNVSPASGTSSR